MNSLHQLSFSHRQRTYSGLQSNEYENNNSDSLMKNATSPFIALFLGSLALGLSSVASAQNFYRWVDANGSTHYTTTPPPKGSKNVGKVTTFAGAPQTQVQNRTNAPAEPPAEAQTEQPKNNTQAPDPATQQRALQKTTKVELL